MMELKSIGFFKALTIGTNEDVEEVVSVLSTQWEGQVLIYSAVIEEDFQGLIYSENPDVIFLVSSNRSRALATIQEIREIALVPLFILEKGQKAETFTIQCVAAGADVCMFWPETLYQWREFKARVTALLRISRPGQRQLSASFS